MKDKLFAYITQHWEEIMKEAMPSMNKKAIVEDVTNGMQYAFIGHGCGITYIAHRKNNKKAEELKKAANSIHMEEAYWMFLNEFTPEQQAYYQNIGCPLGAIWSQDIKMQQAYYGAVKQFADENNINIEIKSFID